MMPNNFGPPQSNGGHHPHHHRGDFYMTRRMGDTIPSRNDHLDHSASSASPSPMGKQQHIFRPNRPLPPALNFEQIRQTSADISETDLYLLSAIEKLVHRVDYLEKRLQTTDKLILHLLNDVRNENNSQTTSTTIAASTTSTTAITKPFDSAQTATTLLPSSVAAASTTLPQPTKPPAANLVDTALCPRDYVAIAKICYYLDRSEHADWKTANGRCRTLGGHLAEFSTLREYKAVAEFLTNGTRFTASSYWLGGLNPGLLWIWSGSAKPVNPASNFAAFGGGGGGKNTTTIIPAKKQPAAKNDDELKTKNVFDIQGNGRCLNLQYNQTLRNFEYYGEDCSRPHGFVCEMRNRNVENEISRVFRALRLE